MLKLIDKDGVTHIILVEHIEEIVADHSHTYLRLSSGFVIYVNKTLSEITSALHELRNYSEVSV